MTDAAELERFLHDRIPLTRAMGLEVRHAGPGTVELWLPLTPNANDKGTGFAGSLASVATLSGWALTRIALGFHGLAVEVAVSASRFEYRAPARAGMLARCEAPEPASVAALVDAVRRRGRGRWTLMAGVTTDRITVLTMEARYAAWKTSG